MNSDSTSWQLLIVSLPANSTTVRMRVWRALKALGCGPLRDGAYLLPLLPPLEAALRELADGIVREGGSAWLLHVAARSPDEEAGLRALFDRRDEYAALVRTFTETLPALAAMAVADVQRTLRKLRRELDALQAIDYFPGDAGAQAQAAWAELARAAESRLAPGEPVPREETVRRRDPAGYRGRTWATRRRLWVDRVASAWLIRRFIDPDARFLWLESPADCPPHAVGFDFDGAEFTHVGPRVTFEVLAAAFGLDADAGLARLGAMVRALDVGEGFVPEAGGFEAILAGARHRHDDDDALLAEIGAVLDSLHAHFSNAT
jgi:hypothetical protein